MRSTSSLLLRAAATLPLLACSVAMAAAPSSPSHAPAAGPRTTTDLATGWRFRFGGDAAGVTAPGYDDTSWETVSLPHTWNHLGAYSLTRTGLDRDSKQGVGWYRLHFQAPRLAAGHRLYLQFDGVGAIAEIWVNGVKVGEHKGAFSRFRFDVTDRIKPGADNLIVVSADNSKPKPGSSTQDVLPLAGDFFVYGGLYRGVSLIEADSAQIDMLDHGGPGVYARTVQVADGAARIAIHTRLRNQSERARRLSLVTAIVDAGGKTVATATSPAMLGAEATGDVEQQLAVQAPHLWNGRADPYLYRVVAELREGGRVIDRVTQPLGIRTFHIDPNQGFFLNGKHLALHGVSRHQDLMGKGWAMTDADQAADMAMIEELGANTIRMAHYEHAQAWTDEADKAGMVAWAEVPFVSESSFDGSPASPALIQNARQQLVELIRQDYNHPSIAMWSVGNEVNAGELTMPGKPQQSLPLLQNLAALAKREDPSRPTTFADCCEDTADFKVHGPPLAGATDLIGYNRYYGWYYGAVSDLGPALDKLHAKHPTIPMGVSEYGAGGAVSQHTDNPEGGQVSMIGRPHPEEYQSWYHEQSWKQLAARKYLFATWVWSMFDFVSDFRGEGDSVDLNDKGLVTFDRKTKKDAFYFYQAQWSDTPMLHLNGRHYVDRAYPVTDVRAYTNARQASLTVNGARIGTVDCPDHICVWKNVWLKPGDNIVEASATAGGAQLSDRLHWTAPDVAQGIHIDSGELSGRMSGAVRYGSDDFFTGGTPTLLNPLVLRPGGGGTKAKKVTGTDDPALHHAYREGSFAYDIPLPDGAWTVTLHMMEPDPALAATRSFDVEANGRTVLRAFSPARAAGAPLVTVTRTFQAKTVNGRLKLDFVARGGPALVSAIDLAKAGEGEQPHDARAH